MDKTPTHALFTQHYEYINHRDFKFSVLNFKFKRFLKSFK